MNDECQMTNDEWRKYPSACKVCVRSSSFVIRHSSFLLSFVIWQSAFVIFLGAFSWPFFSSAAVTSLDDIEFWVGAGANRAGLVIDWAEGSDEPAALAWGYRWDGTATGRDMLVAVLTADDRLFAKLGGSHTNPVSVYGIGYDANGAGAFGLDDGTQFNAAGIAITSPSDLAVAVDPNDRYAEGWFTGLWHYGVSTGNPFGGGSWTTSPSGMADRTLTDGAWDSWAFTPSFDFSAFATKPLAASPPTTLPGDYNGDDVVDALDYDVWAGAIGATGMHAADGNGDGIVDAADYVVWRDRLGESKSLPQDASQQAPEPATISLTFLLIICFVIVNTIRRSSRSVEQKFAKSAKEKRRIVERHSLRPSRSSVD